MTGFDDQRREAHGILDHDDLSAFVLVSAVGDDRDATMAGRDGVDGTRTARELLGTHVLVLARALEVPPERVADMAARDARAVSDGADSEVFVEWGEDEA